MVRTWMRARKKRRESPSDGHGDAPAGRRRDGCALLELWQALAAAGGRGDGVGVPAVRCGE